MIKEAFLASANNYSNNPVLLSELWDELEELYTATYRFYHTLDHLNYLLTILLPYKNNFQHWDTVVFAIAYHDAVYDSRRNDNEEKSAVLASIKLACIGFPEKQIERCKAFILTTKSHAPFDKEVDLFTDADLVILGADFPVYKNYYEAIRKEYSVYSDQEYSMGRLQILTHFLKRESLFKTELFKAKYESFARKNIETELNTLKH